MVFTVIVGVIIYSFFPYASLMDRLIQRIILLPLVIGVSYEVLRFTNLLRDVPVLRFLGYPGLWLQKLTTKEPDDHQVEVSIASFKRMQEIDNLKQSNTLIPLWLEWIDMRSRMTPVTYILLFLIVIGILYSIIRNPSALLIPVVVFGVIYFLYKYPPGRRRQKSEKQRYNEAYKKQKMRNVQKASFKVIKGKKHDDDEPPLYH